MLSNSSCSCYPIPSVYFLMFLLPTNLCFSYLLISVTPVYWSLFHHHNHRYPSWLLISVLLAYWYQFLVPTDLRSSRLLISVFPASVTQAYLHLSSCLLISVLHLCWYLFPCLLNFVTTTYCSMSSCRLTCVPPAHFSLFLVHTVVCSSCLLFSVLPFALLFAIPYAFCGCWQAPTCCSIRTGNRAA